MKKLLYIFLLAAYCKPVTAQVIIALLFGDKLNSDKVEFGLTVWPSLTDISNIEGKVKPGLNLGLYFNIKVSERFSIHPEAIAKSSYGAKDLPTYPTGSDTLDNLFAEGDVERKIKSVGALVMARFQITGLLFAMAGPQADWMLNAKDTYKATVNGSDLDYTVDIDDQVTELDFGFTAGLEYKLKKDKGVGIGLRYFGGMTDIMKNIPGSQVNRAWVLSISIPIGTGKSNAPPK
jgi:hypothetical protein